MRVLEFATVLVSAASAYYWDESYVRDDVWETCETDADCLTWSSCLSFIWKYNDVHWYSAYKGCWATEKCQGTSTWAKEDRVLQFFCNEEQIAKAEEMKPHTWGTQVEKVFDEWEPMCSSTKPCEDPTA